jgi:hypothetical protein
VLLAACPTFRVGNLSTPSRSTDIWTVAGLLGLPPLLAVLARLATLRWMPVAYLLMGVFALPAIPIYRGLQRHQRLRLVRPGPPDQRR